MGREVGALSEEEERSPACKPQRMLVACSGIREDSEGRRGFLAKGSLSSHELSYDRSQPNVQHQRPTFNIRLEGGEGLG